jgi:hypothetical protein
LLDERKKRHCRSPKDFANEVFADEALRSLPVELNGVFADGALADTKNIADEALIGADESFPEESLN